MSEIKGFSGKHAYLSNFYPVKVPYGGIVFPTVENAYQAAKTEKQEERILFQSMTPGQAKRAGKKLVLDIEDWLLRRDMIMEHLIRYKFSVNIPLLIALKSTGKAYIEETNNWGDTYWGVCNSIGKNKLGRILMKIRDELL